MRVTLIYFLLLFCIGSSFNVCAQEWRFPNCNELEVLTIEQSNVNTGVLEISVYNDCDDCTTHVYTGLLLFAGEDTLGIEVNLYSKSSPLNNDSYLYTVSKKSAFEINENLRIEMVGICDSVPFSLELLSTLSSIENLADRITVFPNPAEEFIYLKTQNNIQIEGIAILDHLGRLIKSEININEGIKVSDLVPGIYLLAVKTADGTVYKKFHKI